MARQKMGRQKKPKKKAGIRMEMRQLARFVASDQKQCEFRACSGRCRLAIHLKCERLGLDHQSVSEDNPWCKVMRGRFLERILIVRKPAGWSMGDRTFDSYREGKHPTPDAPAKP